MPSFFRIPCLIATVALAGCAAQMQNADKVFGLLTPYRIDIVQGNVVTKEQIEHLRPGMSRQQVRDVLGTPLIADIFHADRWDYPFTIRRQGAEPQRRTVIVTFDGDVMKNVEAPELPSEREFVASITKSGTKSEPRALELSEDQRNALPTPATPPQAAPSPADPAQPAVPVRTYPPLEPS